MESEILKRKKLIDKDGETIIDLTSVSIRYISDTPVIIDEFYAGDMVMRPDLISHIGYGVVDYYDLVMKFNGISNPYSIDEEDLILIPELSFMRDSLVDPSENDESEEVKSQYIDPSKKFEIDPKKKEYDEMLKRLHKSNKNIKYSEFPLPPNLAKPGSSEGKMLSNGKVLLGSDITSKIKNK